MPTNFDYPPVETQKELKCIVESLTSSGKGIFAADESPWKMGQRFEEIGLMNSEDLRRQWRELLFSTNVSISQSISGIILVEETLRQKDSNDRLMIDLLRERCIIPGIKVDKGLVNLFTTDGELGTQGLDNLDDCLAQYKRDGFEFARWRSVFKIGRNKPSHHALVTNADTIARFASLSQSKGIVPIIEPEVVPDGNHSIERCQKVTEVVLSFVFKALHDHHVFLEGIILKPNMVTAGLSHEPKSKPEEIAEATVATLRRMVPPAISGIFFSSGGQTEEEATENLNAINLVSGAKPWKLTFAYGRALQASAIRIWSGRPGKSKEAQDVFLKRAKANGEASLGRYTSEKKLIYNLVDRTEKVYSSPRTPLQNTDEPVTYYRPIVTKNSPHVNREFLPKKTARATYKERKEIARLNIMDPKNPARVNTRTPKKASRVSFTTPKSSSRVSVTTPESASSMSVTTPESSRVNISESQVSLSLKRREDDDSVDDKYADNAPEVDDENADAGDATTRTENFSEDETAEDDENEADQDDENEAEKDDEDEADQDDEDETGKDDEDEADQDDENETGNDDEDEADQDNESETAKGDEDEADQNDVNGAEEDDEDEADQDDESETAKDDENEPAEDDENVNAEDSSNKIENETEENEANEDDENEAADDDENETAEDDENEPADDDENADDNIEDVDRRSSDGEEFESKNSPSDDNETS